MSMNSGLSKEYRYAIIKYKSFSINSISFLSTFLVFYMYYANRTFRNFGFRLIVYLQFADFSFFFSMILTYFSLLEIIIFVKFKLLLEILYIF